MERHTVVDLMIKLKLRGMRAAYDEIITQANWPTWRAGLRPTAWATPSSRS